jgi:hypothetical protein
MMAWFLSFIIKIIFMKNGLRLVTSYFQKLLLMFMAVLFNAIAFAQDKKVDINISTNKNNGFWGSPWVWVIGAAVFILLLVAILRGGSRRDA